MYVLIVVGIRRPSPPFAFNVLHYEIGYYSFYLLTEVKIPGRYTQERKSGENNIQPSC